MPIYEYACPHCRKIMNFFVRTFGAAENPACPRCGRNDLERLMSRFAVKTSPKARGPAAEPAAGGGAADFGGGAGDGPGDGSPAEEARFEHLMDTMGSDIDKIDENDPRQIGRFLRKFGEAAGEDLGPEFREAVGRLEAGEDPEKVEEQLSQAFGDDAAGDGGEDGGGGGPYSRDDTLYDL